MASYYCWTKQSRRRNMVIPDETFEGPVAKRKLSAQISDPQDADKPKKARRGKDALSGVVGQLYDMRQRGLSASDELGKSGHNVAKKFVVAASSAKMEKRVELSLAEQKAVTDYEASLKRARGISKEVSNWTIDDGQRPP